MDDEVRIATVNVNGLRASLGRGFDRWLATCGADVVALDQNVSDLADVQVMFDAMAADPSMA